MSQRWAQGREDAEITLAAAPWSAPKTKEVGVRVFDVWHSKMLEKRSAADEAQNLVK
jgi:hypothetical protein